MRPILVATCIAIFASGCAHRVASWSEQPSAMANLDSGTLFVEAAEPECESVARELSRLLVEERGLRLDAGAPNRLVLEHCGRSMDVHTELRVDDPWFGETDGGDGLRRVLVEGEAAVLARLDRAGAEPLRVDATALESSQSSWSRGADDATKRQLRGARSLDAALAWDLAQQLAPVPEAHRRRLFSVARPGTAQALHNEAVEAEQQGDLERALDRAREAYVARPTWPALGYVRVLERRVARTSGVADAL